MKLGSVKIGRKSEEHQHAAPAVQPVVPNAAVSTSRLPAAFPRVNLIPDTIAKEAKARRAKLVLFAAVALAIAAVAALFYLAQAQVSDAQMQVDTATARSQVLNTELGKYSSFTSAKADVLNAQQQMDLAMGGEVRWSALINQLSLTMPAGVSLTEFKGSVDGISPTKNASTTGGTAAAPSGSQLPGTTSVLGTPGIGVITYSGEAKSYSDVAGFLDSISKQSTMLDPYPNSIQVNSATTGSGGSQGLLYSATVTINDHALSHRYTMKAGS